MTSVENSRICNDREIPTEDVKKEEAPETEKEISSERQGDNGTQPEGSEPIENYADSAEGAVLPDEKLIEGVRVEAGAEIISDDDEPIVVFQSADAAGATDAEVTQQVFFTKAPNSETVDDFGNIRYVFDDHEVVMTPDGTVNVYESGEAVPAKTYGSAHSIPPALITGVYDHDRGTKLHHAQTAETPETLQALIDQKAWLSPTGETDEAIFEAMYQKRQVLMPETSAVQTPEARARWDLIQSLEAKRLGGEFDEGILDVFGEDADVDGFMALLDESMLTGDFGWVPSFRFMEMGAESDDPADGTLQGAVGAYVSETNEIVVASDLQGDAAAINFVGMHELGHKIDEIVHPDGSDTEGDEGLAFSLWMEGAFYDDGQPSGLSEAAQAAFSAPSDAGWITNPETGARLEVEFFKPFRALGGLVKQAVSTMQSLVSPSVVGTPLERSQMPFAGASLLPGSFGNVISPAITTIFERFSVLGGGNPFLGDFHEPILGSQINLRPPFNLGSVPQMSLPGLSEPYSPPANYQSGDPVVYTDDNGDTRAIVFGNASDYGIVEQPPGSGVYDIQQGGRSVLGGAPQLDFISFADEPSPTTTLIPVFGEGGFPNDDLTILSSYRNFDEYSEFGFGKYPISGDLEFRPYPGLGFSNEPLNVEPSVTINLKDASSDANGALARETNDAGVLSLLADLGERDIDWHVARNSATSQQTLQGLSQTYYGNGSAVDWPMAEQIASNGNAPADIKTQIATHESAPLSALAAVARNTDVPTVLESIFENYAQRGSILPQMQQILSQFPQHSPQFEQAMARANSEIILLRTLASNAATPPQTLSDVYQASLEHSSVASAVVARASDPATSEEDLFAIASSDLVTNLEVAQAIAANPNADHHTLIAAYVNHPDDPTIAASVTGGDSGLEPGPHGRRLVGELTAFGNVSGLTETTVGFFPEGLVALSPAVEAPTFGAVLAAATPYAVAGAVAYTTISLGVDFIHRLDPTHPVNVSVNEVNTAMTNLTAAEQTMWQAYEDWQMQRNDPTVQAEFIGAVNAYANAVGDLEWALMGVETFLNGHATLSSSERGQLEGLLNEFNPVLATAADLVDRLYVDTEIAWTSPFDEPLPQGASLEPFAEDLAAAYQSNPEQVLGYLSSRLATSPELTMSLVDTLGNLPNRSSMASEINTLLFGSNPADGRALFLNDGPLDWENPENITEAEIRTAIDDLPDWGDAALLYRLNTAAQVHNEQEALTSVLTNVLDGLDSGAAAQALLHYEYMHIADPAGTARTADIALDALAELATRNPSQTGQILEAMAQADVLAVGSLIQRTSDLVDVTGGELGAVEAEMRLMAALSLTNPELGQQVADSVNLYDQWSHAIIEATDTAGGATQEVISLMGTFEQWAAPVINGILDGIAELRNIEFATQMAFGIYEVYAESGPAAALAGIAGWAARAAVDYGTQALLATLATQVGAAPDPNQYPESHRLYMRLIGTVASQIVGAAHQAAVDQDPQVPVDNPGLIADGLVDNFDQTQLQLFASTVPEFSQNLGLLASQWPGTTGDNPVFAPIGLLEPEEQALALVAMDTSDAIDFLQFEENAYSPLATLAHADSASVASIYEDYADDENGVEDYVEALIEQDPSLNHLVSEPPTDMINIAFVRNEQGGFSPQVTLTIPAGAESALTEDNIRSIYGHAQAGLSRFLPLDLAGVQLDPRIVVQDNSGAVLYDSTAPEVNADIRQLYEYLDTQGYNAALQRSDGDTPPVFTLQPQNGGAIPDQAGQDAMRQAIANILDLGPDDAFELNFIASDASLPADPLYTFLPPSGVASQGRSGGPIDPRDESIYAHVPNVDPERPYLNEFPHTAFLSDTSRANLVVAQPNNSFSGVIDIESGQMFITAVDGSHPSYSTQDPIGQSLFPQQVGGDWLVPLVHGGTGTPNTSHSQLARAVVSNYDSVRDENQLGGFSIRFTEDADGTRRVILSATSRSLNVGEGFGNGQLEPAIQQAILESLTPFLTQLGWGDNISWGQPRFNGQSYANAMGGNNQFAGNTAGLFANLLQNTKRVV